MKKVLVAILVAAMLLVSMSVFAMATDEVVNPDCTCDGHTHGFHVKNAETIDCDCGHVATPTEAFLAWIAEYIGPKVADVIYRIIV